MVLIVELLMSNSKRLAVCSIVALGYLAFTNSGAKWSLVLPAQEQRCLEHSVFLHKYTDKFSRGDVVSFVLEKDLPPYFKKGQHFMKIAAAVEGDKVTVTHQTVTITTPRGEMTTYKKDLNYVLSAVNKPLDEIEREFEVDKGQFFALGTTLTSYDSAFWGTHSASKVTGVGYAIF